MMAADGCHEDFHEVGVHAPFTREPAPHLAERLAGPGMYTADEVERIAADRVAAAVAPFAALADEYAECWVLRSREVTCADLIGGVIGERPGQFIEQMACLPCRLRALLAEVSE